MTTNNDSDHIYFNFRIEAENELKTLAKYSENRVTPILTNPSDYELGVMRYSIPTNEIPLRFWKDNSFGITLKHNNVNYFEYLQFIPNSSSDPVKTIYFIQEIVDILNQAFATAFALIPGITSTQAPQMIYDPVTDLLSLNVEQTFITDGIEIFWNQELNPLMYAFQNYYNEDPPSQQVFRWVVKDRGNNSSTVNGQPSFLMTQDYPNTFAWSELKSIRFETNSIPVKRELEGAQRDVQTLLLTDFEIIKSRFDRNAITFFPRGPIRFTDLQSDYPMKRIDVSVSWVDTYNVAHPLYISGGDALTMKILFRKKLYYKLVDFIDEEIEEKLQIK